MCGSGSLDESAAADHAVYFLISGVPLGVGRSDFRTFTATVTAAAALVLGRTDDAEEEDTQGQSDDSEGDESLPMRHGNSTVRGLVEAEEASTLIDDQRSSIGKDTHENELANCPFPRARFPCDHCRGG